MKHKVTKKDLYGTTITPLFPRKNVLSFRSKRRHVSRKTYGRFSSSFLLFIFYYYFTYFTLLSFTAIALLHAQRT